MIYFTNKTEMIKIIDKRSSPEGADLFQVLVTNPFLCNHETYVDWDGISDLLLDRVCVIDNKKYFMIAIHPVNNDFPNHEPRKQGELLDLILRSCKV